MENKIELGSIFFDREKRHYCKIGFIEFMCENKYISYVRIDYDDLTINPGYVSEYSLANNEKFIPVRSEHEKLVINLKYFSE